MTDRPHLPADYTAENMDTRAQRLKALLATIDLARARLELAVAERWTDAKTGGLAAGEIGRIFAARAAYAESGGE